MSSSAPHQTTGLTPGELEVLAVLEDGEPQENTAPGITPDIATLVFDLSNALVENGDTTTLEPDIWIVCAEKVKTINSYFENGPRCRREETLEQKTKSTVLRTPISTHVRSYFGRMAGVSGGDMKGPHIPTGSYLLWVFLGCMIGISVMGTISFEEALLLNEEETPGTDLGHFGLVTSFGAQAVLLYGVPQAPFAQPWNAIAGSTLSALVGVACQKAGGDTTSNYMLILQSSFAVSLAVIVMLLTGSVHPPAGATALSAVVGSSYIKDMGWSYALFPILIGSVLQVSLALVLNNLSCDPTRSYPVYWVFWRNMGSSGSPWYAKWPVYQAPTASRSSN
mmetsp:Transcript_45612/g.102991  ORF Transcript_45612/g.102991 Transcript_45612/m.102991 type:complete len:337 (+) Transcript_45612:191-1201(+)